MMLLNREFTGIQSINLNQLHGACLAGCRFRGVELVIQLTTWHLDFTNADFSGALLRGGGDLPNCSFSGVRGFSGRERLRVLGNDPTLDPAHPARFEDMPTGSSLQRLILRGAPGWDSIRSLGDLPVFGISYVALSGVLVYAAGARWYNHQIETVQGFASGVVEEHPDSSLQFLSNIAARLHDAPRPWELGALLLGLLLLAVGSTLYKVRCPTIIQHYRLPQWEESGRSAFLWLGQNWSYYWSRKVCSILYGLGGVVTLAYVAPRVFAAMRYFVGL